jgi:hypothetical protein
MIRRYALQHITAVMLYQLSVPVQRISDRGQRLHWRRAAADRSAEIFDLVDFLNFCILRLFTPLFNL